MKTTSGPIEFKRGPIAWNPANRGMLDKLCVHVTDNRNPDTEIRYNMRNGETGYLIQIPGRPGHEVHRRHPWHPDYGHWIREEFRKLMHRGINFPVDDTAPKPWEDAEQDVFNYSYVELQTVHVARRLFRAGRVHARREPTRAYALNLRFSGTITEQREQDDSTDASLATQYADASNR